MAYFGTQGFLINDLALEVGQTGSSANMALRTRIEQFEGDLGIILPNEVLTRLNVKAGDTLEFVTTRALVSLLLQAYDPEFERQTAGLRQIMDENRDVLKRLADS